MNGAGGDERVDPGPLGVLHGLPGSTDVLFVAPGEAADDGDVAVVVDGVADVLGDHLDGLEVVVGGGGEAGLDDVDAELSELARNVELLLGGHGGAGGLLAVAEGGVEDPYIRGVRDVVRDVRRQPPPRKRGFGAGNGELGIGMMRVCSEGGLEARMVRGMGGFRGRRETEEDVVVVVVVGLGRGNGGGGRDNWVAEHGRHGNKTLVF